MLKVKKITSLFLSLSLAITPIFIFAEDEISLENESTIFEIAEGEEVESIDVAINVVSSKIAEDEKKSIELEKKSTELEKTKNSESIIPSSVNSTKMIAYIRKINPSTSVATATKIYNSTVKYSKTYNVDPFYVFAIMEHESKFNPNVSYMGAHGLMQLQEGTYQYIGIKRSEVFDIDKNIRAGTYELSTALKMFGSYNMAIAAYAYGSGNVKKGNYTMYFSNRMTNIRNKIANAVK